MKKIIAVLAAFAVVFSFTACGGKNNTEETGETPQVSNVLVRSVYDEENYSYKNSYTQISVEVPGDWYVYTDNDLAMAYLNGMVTGDEFSMWSAADYKNKTVIPDFAIMDMANKNNLSVVYVNTDNLENGEVSDEKSFHSLVIGDITAQGFVLDQTDDEIVTLDGQDFYSFKFKGKDTDFYFAIRQQENYMIVITATDRSGAGRDMFFSFI